MEPMIKEYLRQMTSSLRKISDHLQKVSESPFHPADVSHVYDHLIGCRVKHDSRTEHLLPSFEGVLVQVTLDYHGGVHGYVVLDSGSVSSMLLTSLEVVTPAGEVEVSLGEDARATRTISEGEPEPVGYAGPERRKAPRRTHDADLPEGFDDRREAEDDRRQP